MLDPLSQLPKDGIGGKLRCVAKEHRGLWDGTTFPLYRQKIYLGYDYGARVEADARVRLSVLGTGAVVEHGSELDGAVLHAGALVRACAAKSITRGRMGRACLS